MGVKKALNFVGDIAANKVAKLSALSSDQVKQINSNREEFLSKIPDPDDPNAVELSNRLLSASGVEIFDLYLTQVKDLYKPVDSKAEFGREFSSEHNIRFLNITKWVTDKNENSIEKLVNVYDVLSKEQCNIALVFNRTTEKTDVFLAVVNSLNDKNNVNADSYIERIRESIKGNFPGSEFDKEIGRGRIPCLNTEEKFSVATATNIPAEKSERFINQTIEKLLDGVIPESSDREYTIVLLATPVHDIQERKMKLSEFYSGLAPYSSWQTNYTFTEAKSNTAMATFGVNIGTSAGSQRTKSSAGTRSESESINKSHSDTKTTGTSGGVNLGANVPFTAAGSQGPSGSLGAHVDTFASSSVSETLGKALSTVLATTDAIAKGTNRAVNLGASFSRASNVTATVGMNEGITQSYVNYNIKHTLDNLENQMKRYEQSTALGMWDFSAYVVSKDVTIANNVAHSYLALTQGEESFLSNSAVNVWRGDLGDQNSEADEICSYIRDLRHPLFAIDPDVLVDNEGFYVYPPVVTTTTLLSGKELAYSMNMPQKSIAGLPVFQCASFGREIVTYDSLNMMDRLRIGNVYHMHHVEKKDVLLSEQSFASHVFITGSTGSGKSNTSYKILEEMMSRNVRFMVIEPAKGEYKHIFGNRENVTVYSTNPDVSELLKIDPFSFPEGIHVFEHMDRLVELFNVCWPMYAAMPAVLKSAIEQSYVDCGWDLITSTNKYDRSLFPSFNDVARNVRSIIDSSEYNSENKGAYKGSLLTRLVSLTNGINGLVFSSEEIPSTDLFDSNVIVDLSRVGSSETKSLLMGMLVMKLQEYRMSSSNEINSKLRHITVLEEAHNILKKTSTEQSSEGANLVGKSVEMISDAIAEMRTYGEGFIIIDQAPGLIDMSAIRNTNTKIIMRLPDSGDRELIGRSANLDDRQIEELSRLSCGVAAIYQNEWIQPVLCKVDRVMPSFDKYNYKKAPGFSDKEHLIARLAIADMLSKGMRIGTDISEEEICAKMDLCALPSSLRVKILRYMDNPPKHTNYSVIGSIMYDLLPRVSQKIKKAIDDEISVRDWTLEATNEVRSYGVDDQLGRDILLGIISHYLLNELNNQDMLRMWLNEGGVK